MYKWGARGREGNSYRRFYSRAVFGLTASNPDPATKLWNDLYFTGGVNYIQTLSYSIGQLLTNDKVISKVNQYTVSNVASIIANLISGGIGYSKTLAYSIGQVAANSKSVGKVAQYTSNTVESIIKVINKVNQYTSNTVESISKSIGKFTQHTSNTVESLTKVINKRLNYSSVLVNTINAVGIFGGIVFNKTLNYAVTVGETLTRSVSKVNAYSVSKSVTQTKVVGKSLTFAKSTGLTIARVITKLITLTPGKSYTVSKRTARALNYTVSGTITVLKGINKTLGYVQTVEQSIVTLFISGGFVQAFQKMVALFRFGNVETRHESAVVQYIDVIIDSVSSDQLDQAGNVNHDQAGRNQLSQDYVFVAESIKTDCILNNVVTVDCTPTLTNDNYILDQAGNVCLTQSNANLII